MNYPAPTSEAPTPASFFTWRDRRGQHHQIEHMETRHLFYVIRMIWNHSMPVKTEEDYRRYHFGPTYTEKYLKDAIRYMVPELARRDLSGYQRTTIDFMTRFLSTYQVEADKQRRIHGRETGS